MALSVSSQLRAHVAQAGLGGFDAAELPNHVTHRVDVGRLAEQKHQLARFSRRQRDRDVQRGARIEPGAETLRQRLTAKRRGLRQRAVAAEELSAIAGRRGERLADMREGDALGEVAVEHVAGQQRAGFGVELGRHVQLRIGVGRTQRPFGVAEDAEPARRLARDWSASAART